MTFEKMKYTLIGVILSILVFLLMSASANESNEIGRYQISSTSDNWKTVYIVDTKTGVVKIAYKLGNNATDQLGKTFDEMK